MVTIAVLLLVANLAFGIYLYLLREKIRDDAEELESLFEDLQGDLEDERQLARSLLETVREAIAESGDTIRKHKETVTEFHSIARAKMLADRDDIIATRKEFLAEVAKTANVRRIGK